MRFMVVVEADKNTEAGLMPSAQLVADMGRYNEELVNAEVLRAAEERLREQVPGGGAR